MSGATAVVGTGSDYWIGGWHDNFVLGSDYQFAIAVDDAQTAELDPAVGSGGIIETNFSGQDARATSMWTQATNGGKFVYVTGYSIQ